MWNPTQIMQYQDFDKFFNKYNIATEDGIILLNYFEALALIGIEYHNNKEIDDLEYGEI